MRSVLCFAVNVVVLGQLVTAATVPVVADVSLNEANPNANLNSITTRGGLLSGLDDTGSNYAFLLKFNLDGIDSADVSSATLVGVYTDDFGPVDTFHQVFFVSDDSWAETIVTWNSRPTSGVAIGAGFNAIEHVPGDSISFDITADVQREAAGDGWLSLSFSTIDGRFGDLEYFASREFDAASAFRIEIASPIPLPPALIPGAVVLAGGLFVAIRRGSLL